MSHFIPPPPAGRAPPPDPARGAMRAKLLAARLELGDRDVRSQLISDRLLRWLRTVPVTRIAFYWPIRGEPDVTAAMTTWRAGAAERVLALPVVVRDQLEFAPWTARSRMRSGAYGIQEPDTDERIKPQLLVIPCVGIDRNRYRLGYGAGYYDRTLERSSIKPSTVGVAFDCSVVASIEPKPHDVRLDLALTESGAL